MNYLLIGVDVEDFAKNRKRMKLGGAYHSSRVASKMKREDIVSRQFPSIVLRSRQFVLNLFTPVQIQTPPCRISLNRPFTFMTLQKYVRNAVF
jgi:hypothetical protein